MEELQQKSRHGRDAEAGDRGDPDWRQRMGAPQNQQKAKGDRHAGFSRLAPGEFALLEALSRGQRLEQACAIAVGVEQFDLSLALAGFLAGGFLTEPADGEERNRLPP